MSLRQIVYVSSGIREYSIAELEKVAETGARNNGRNGVTGILLHYNGNFMQLLEGETDAVEETFERISADPRHTGILKLQDDQIDQRRFPDSRMALRSIAEGEMTNYPDLFEKGQVGWQVKTDAEIDRKLVVLFKTFFKINAGERG